MSPATFATALATAAALALLALLPTPAAHASWTIPSGSVLPNTSRLVGVACPGVSACLMVGFQQGTTTTALAADWNGSVFGAVTTVSTTADLYDTTCTSTDCFVVGVENAGGGAAHAERYDGSTWSAMTTPVPSGSTYSILAGVSCPGTTTCFAVGYYETATANLPLIEGWNGTSWTIQSLSLPPTMTNAKLIDVSCASTTACKAVGYIENSGQPRRTFVMNWDGTSWTTDTSANHTGAYNGQLHGVECASASLCTAVGTYNDSSNVQHALAEGWNGSAWALQTVPDPTASSSPVLEDVSCVTSPSYACTAVGEYTSSTPNVEPMAAGLSSGTWTLQSVPRPTGVSDAALLGIACPSSTCLAVGVSIYDGSTGVTGLRPLVEFGP